MCAAQQHYKIRQSLPLDSLFLNFEGHWVGKTQTTAMELVLAKFTADMPEFCWSMVHVLEAFSSFYYSLVAASRSSAGFERG